MPKIINTFQNCCEEQDIRPMPHNESEYFCYNCGCVNMKPHKETVYSEQEVQNILERIERQEDFTCVLQTIKHIRNDYNINKEK
jgi:hypothetical protein